MPRRAHDNIDYYFSINGSLYLTPRTVLRMDAIRKKRDKPDFYDFFFFSIPLWTIRPRKWQTRRKPVEMQSCAQEPLARTKNHQQSLGSDHLNKLLVSICIWLWLFLIAVTWTCERVWSHRFRDLILNSRAQKRSPSGDLPTRVPRSPTTRNVATQRGF